LLTYTLDVYKDGDATGDVILEPAGGVYDYGTVVTLTATFTPGVRFGGWSGHLSGDDNPETLLMDGDKVVTATFSVPLTYTLTTLVSPPGSGEVLLNPPGGVYEENTVVQLTANPFEGYEFVRWGGDLTGTVNLPSITMTRDVSVTAMFEQSGFGVYLPLLLKQ
jgi:hypothetical protein